MAHTNKNRQGGKPVPGGVGDLRNDCDCAFILDVIQGDKPGTDRKTVKFENIKMRGSVQTEAAYSFTKENKVSYEDLIASVEPLDSSELVEVETKVDQQNDSDLIEQIKCSIRNGITTKMKLADDASSNAGVSKRSMLKLIEKYTGDDPAIHLWAFDVKERGAKHYRLLEPVDTK